MTLPTLPNRLPLQYIKKTQVNCQACIEGLDTIHNGSKHTCAYGEELYSNINDRVFSPYSHKTDHMCASHGHNWVHVGCMSEKDENGDWTNNCGCGWQGPVNRAGAEPNGPEAKYVARHWWAHQDQFCTCYYELKEETAMSIDERMAMERELPFVEIPMVLVFETMKTCQACNDSLSQLEADHTCMFATGELSGLMYLENKACLTHRTEKRADGYGHYCGHLAELGTPGKPADHYRCRACNFTTDTFSDLAGNVRATRDMVMHRMSHCSCYFVDLKTWRIKRD